MDLQDQSLQRALAAANSGIVIADATTEGFPLTFVNAAFERLTGYTAQECVGRNCRFLQGPATDPASIAAVSAALRDGRESVNVLLNYRADGSIFYNELRLAPVHGPNNRIELIIGVQNDVTETVEELTVLRALQESLRPVGPAQRPGLEVADVFVPAEQGVAGDFHLVTAGPRDSTVLVVGDVMGHGAGAARRASYVRTSLSTFGDFTDDPLRLLEMANHSLIERIGTSAEFVTAVCVSYDPEDRRLRWAGAGHPAPLSLRTGEPLEGAGAGLPLGIDIDLGGRAGETRLDPGDGILLYTDGLTEARSVTDQRRASATLGDARVTALVREHEGASAREVVDGLAEAVAEHTGGQPADDLCLVALRAAA